MNDKDYAIMWAHFHRPEKIRALSISISQRAALAKMQKGAKLTSRELAASIPGCAVREASRMLSDLEKKGYAIRCARPDRSGGIFYEYTLADFLRYEGKA